MKEETPFGEGVFFVDTSCSMPNPSTNLGVGGSNPSGRANPSNYLQNLAQNRL
jgi:hypothetical protein